MEFSVNQTQCSMAAPPEDSNLPGSFSHLSLDDGHWSREDHLLLDKKILSKLKLNVISRMKPDLDMLLLTITDRSAHKLKLVGSEDAEALISKYTDLEAMLHNSWEKRSFKEVWGLSSHLHLGFPVSMFGKRFFGNFKILLWMSLKVYLPPHTFGSIWFIISFWLND